jgi:DNA-3-methyladenine glycosylase II
VVASGSKRPRRGMRTSAVIAGEADIAAGVEYLACACPAMAAAYAAAGAPPLRRWSAGFDGVVGIVTGQQLSIASAAAILTRLSATVVPLDAATLLATSEADLRAAGLSTAKIATVRALAEAVACGDLDFDALQRASAEDVRAGLTAIRGIGPWTADIYLLFCRGDRDAFAPGDLALQIGVERLMALPERPVAAELAAIAERWRPWRGVAARLIWAYYGHLKAQDKNRVAIGAAKPDGYPRAKGST